MRVSSFLLITVSVAYPPFSSKRAQLALLSEPQAEVEQTAPPTCAEETVFVHFSYKSGGFQRCAAEFLGQYQVRVCPYMSSSTFLAISNPGFLLCFSTCLKKSLEEGAQQS